MKRNLVIPIILVAGIVIRILEILMLGRKANLAEAKGSEMSSGMKTILTRSIPDPDTFKRSTFVVIAGYIFHIGLFVTIFLFAPHILLIKDIIGFGWPSAPTPIVDALAVISIIANTVTISEEKGFVIKIFSNSQQSTSGT